MYIKTKHECFLGLEAISLLGHETEFRCLIVIPLGLSRPFVSFYVRDKDGNLFWDFVKVDIETIKFILSL